MPKGRPKKPVALPTRQVKTPPLLRGFKDILPAEEKYWKFLRQIAERVAGEFGYQRIEIPLVEESGLYLHAIGRETDIVSKELFSFALKDGTAVSLRPEGTAGVARAYINHGMFSLPQPIKLWYRGPMFRYDRPQAGRLRQFHQFGYEILGGDHPILDAELIGMSAHIFKTLNIPTTLFINSLGCSVCRPIYLKELTGFLRTNRKRLCADCKERMKKNVLRALDCKEESCQAIYEEAPKTIDLLDDDCKKHFTRTLEYLDEMGISYTLEPRLVRGLDYYTRTVFEIVPAEAMIPQMPPAAEDADKLSAKSAGLNPSVQSSSRQDTLAGGGRYDNLVEMLGGRPTPALGVSFGCERLLNFLRSKIDAMPYVEPFGPQVFFAQLGEKARRKMLKLREDLRSSGVRIADAFYKDGLRAQLEVAGRLKTRWTVILGEKEVMDGTVIVRDMEEGIQEIVPFDKVAEVLRGKLTAIS